jgi:hypothetical protein
MLFKKFVVINNLKYENTAVLITMTSISNTLSLVHNQFLLKNITFNKQKPRQHK